MSFYGRHRVYALFWTWSIGPFLCIEDIAQASGSKSCGGTGRCKLDLFPRRVPIMRNGVVARASDSGYMDVLRPNDWVFVFVDPGDGEQHDPLFMGLIDDVRWSSQLDAEGRRNMGITVSCSSWEKAIETTMCISNLWVSSNISIANLFDIAIQTSDGEYAPLIPGAIASIMRTFLDAEQREEFVQRQTNEFSTREDLGMSEMETILDEISRVESDRNQITEVSRQRLQADTRAIQTIMGQFELPNTRIPLWRLIKLRFEDLRERTFTIPQTMVSMLGSPLSAFIDEWSNNTINEMIYDVRRVSNDGTAHLERGGRRISQEAVNDEENVRSILEDVIESAGNTSSAIGQLFEDMAPYAILMRRPLFLDELEDLEGPTLDASDFTSLNLGVSDSDHYNMSFLECSVLDPGQFKAATGMTGFDFDRTRALEMVRRHGLRIYNDTLQSWPDNSAEGEPPTVPTHSRELFRDWNERIALAGLDQIELLSGDFTIPKYLRDIWIGGKVHIAIPPDPGVYSDGTYRVFYVDSMDWSYRAQNGQFQTSCGVNRGYEAQRT